MTYWSGSGTRVASTDGIGIKREHLMYTLAKVGVGGYNAA